MPVAGALQRSYYSGNSDMYIVVDVPANRTIQFFGYEDVLLSL